MARIFQIPGLCGDIHEITGSRGESAQIAPEMGGWALAFEAVTGSGASVKTLHSDYEEMALYPGKIRGGSPLLFPFPSWVMNGGKKDVYDVGGKLFHLPQHGFLRKLPFRVTGGDKDSSLVIETSFTPETLAVYPFEFSAQIAFSIEQGVFTTTATFTNLSASVPMPLAFGFHPYLPVPLSGKGSRNEMVVEMPHCTEITQGAEDWSSHHATPFEGGEVSIAQDFSGTRYFTQFAYGFMRLLDRTSGLALKVAWHSDTPRQYVALWAPDTDSAYFCIEPWSHLPNAFGRPDELAVLAPGRKTSWSLSLSVEEL
ncbi:hypothetical protein QPK87_36310 [Kamptonema cortianum]|nr:hypothetical protein [Kamptonema cortianum]MDL5050093.1 hypothetical protein [Oscillatoria amoena NRMC-F 0135]